MGSAAQEHLDLLHYVTGLQARRDSLVEENLPFMIGNRNVLYLFLLMFIMGNQFVRRSCDRCRAPVISFQHIGLGCQFLLKPVKPGRAGTAEPVNGLVRIANGKYR